MNRLLLVCALMSACATTSGSTSKTAEKAQDASVFYPLGLGTEWNYEVKLLGETRVVDVKITKKNDDGFIEDSMGAKLLTDSYGVRDQKRYLLRNPVVAGTKWTNVVSVSSVETYEILAVNQPCDSPAGTFENCVIVESRNRIKEGTTLVNEVTYAPNVGIVKLSTVLDAGDRQIPQSTLSLLKFTAAH
jgi:Ni/Co efflux regulator RcnB